MDPRLAQWLAAAHGAPTQAQARSFPLLEAGEHVLLSSPTGSGKTLAAFLPILSDLASRELADKTYVVYVSPLKALVNDMARNLAAPIAGAGLAIRVAVRTGDTKQGERAKQARRPPHVLITTPESLALLLASPKSRAHLLAVRWVVVDEIHSLAADKRGAQMSLTLERLAAYVGEFQRVGLSATVRPLDRIARFLGGDRRVSMVEVQPTGTPDLEVAMPAADPLKLSPSQLQHRVLDIVEGEMARSRTLLVFTNTRMAAESLARDLRERHSPGEIEEAPTRDVEHALPHHGSMSRTSRLDVEERLKHARVRAVVASSSLELGIHSDAVDRVLLLGSPKGSARTLQRIGRSGHTPGATARATLLVTDPCDLPEADALQHLARERIVEDVVVPCAPLDVLMQHLVAMRLELPLARDDAFALTRRAYPYRDLPQEEFDAVYDDLPRVPRHEYLQNAGTIPESGMLKVFHDQRFVGEIDEEFVSMLHEDDVFLLAGRAWRFVDSTPTRALVKPARSREAESPIWRGEGLGASRLLVEERCRLLCHASTDYPWMELQMRWAGHPCEGALVESFPLPEKRAIVFHAHVGRRANDALALAVGSKLASSRVVSSDWGFAVFLPRGERLGRAQIQHALQDPIEPALREILPGTELLPRRFRHVTMRALVVRRREGEGISMRQQQADRIFQRLPLHHPLVRECFEECLRGAMDVDAAEAWRQDVVAGRRKLKLVDGRPCASPLAARIIAPPGEMRHGELREHADAIAMYDRMQLSKTLD